MMNAPDCFSMESNAGAGRSCAFSMRVVNCGPALDKILAWVQKLYPVLYWMPGIRAAFSGFSGDLIPQKHGERKQTCTDDNSRPCPSMAAIFVLSDPTPHIARQVAIPLSHCVSCGIADYRCYTPTSFRKTGLPQSKDRPWKEGIAEKLASEAHRAMGGAARNSIANRVIVGH